MSDRNASIPNDSIPNDSIPNDRTRRETVGADHQALIDLSHGVTLDIRQFEATRNADRPEYDYVDHTGEFTAADSFGIHIPEAIMYRNRDLPETTDPEGATLELDNSWLRRLVPFKR